MLLESTLPNLSEIKQTYINGLKLSFEKAQKMLQSVTEWVMKVFLNPDSDTSLLLYSVISNYCYYILTS